MSGSRARVSAPMLLFSVIAVSSAVGLAGWAIVRGQGAAAMAPGRCEVTATVSAGTEIAELPLAVARNETEAIVLFASPQATDGGVAIRLRVARVPDQGTTETIWTGTAPSAESVAGFTRTREGVAFAVARWRDVTGYVIPPTGAVREQSFPRGEAPPGRDALSPSLALAAQPDDTLSALARWSSLYGTRRITTRDVRESEAYTARRDDAFHAPDLCVLGDVVLLAQEHHEGSFESAAPRRSRVEVVAMDAAPAHADVLATLPLPREDVAGQHPRVAALDPASPASGAVVVWRDAQGLLAARVAREGSWRALQTMRVVDGPGEVTGDHDVSSAQGSCAVVAWRSGDAVVTRGFDLVRGLSGPTARVALPVEESVAGQVPRVRVERAGARTLLAADSDAGPQLFELTVGDGCAVTARALAVPRSAGARLVGVATSADQAVLAMSRAAPDVTPSELSFVTSPAVGPLRLAPRSVIARQGAADMVMLAGDVPVLVGRSRSSVMLLRVGGSAEETGPDEELLLRGMRGEQLAVDASSALRRVWVADVSEEAESAFGPPRSVVVHSAIDTLEDGPRTELRPGVVPFADFARVTLTRTTHAQHDAWAVTLSASPGGDGECVPGAWAALRTSEDAAITPATPPAESPWPWAIPLIPRAQRSCADRVMTAMWSGTRLTATVLGPRVGAQLAVGDVADGRVRLHALDDAAGAHPRNVSVVRARNGALALWLDGDPLSPSLRARMFARDGTPRTPVVRLGEITEAPGDVQPGDPMPLDGGDEHFVAVFRTVRGPRVARISCGAVP